MRPAVPASRARDQRCPTPHVSQASEWIGAGKLKRRRRAIGLREIAIKCQVRRELVGRANHGIKMGVCVLTIKRWVVAEFVRQIDLGEVEASAGSDR
jgi:hypothetical protein